jgi:hypothetical protein
MSIDTSRSEQLEGHCGIASPAYLSVHGGKGQPFRKLVAYTVNICNIMTHKETIPNSNNHLFIMGYACGSNFSPIL